MIFIGIIGAVFLIDYFVKIHAEKELDNQAVKKIAKGNIILRKVYNRGIAFGWFKDEESITIVGTAIAIGATIYAFFEALLRRGSILSKLGYACILGGGLNNLYERYAKGYVTDYFSFNVKWEKLKRLVFNISDMFILIGAFLIVLGKLFGNKNK